MTHDEARAIVAKLTYRPGWRIECYVPLHSDALVLRVGTDEPDSEKPNGPKIPVVFTDALEWDRLKHMEPELFVAWIYGVFHKRVEHELREWLRLDGRPVIEPHPEQGWTRGVLPQPEVVR